MPTEAPNGANDAGVPPASYEKPLGESLEDASVLLWYATREGKEVSEKVLRDIVQAQLVLSEGTRNPEMEGRFWVAFRDLATVVQPATVDSILATYSYPFGDYNRSSKRRLTDAATTKKKYSIASVMVLFLLLIVQIYWFIGTTWRDDLEKNRAELDSIAGSLREMSLNLKTAEYLAAIKGQQASDVEAGKISFEGDFGRDARSVIKEQLLLLRNEQDKTSIEYANITLRGDRVEKMLRGNYRMLDWWDFVTEIAADERIDIGSGQDDNGEASDQRTVRNLMRTGIGAEFLDEILNKAKLLEEEQLGVEDALVNSKSTLAILSQYVLPLLYGLLGALAYILRTLSKEIQDVTFTRGSEIRYSLRWPLGMLGGVTVGLFFDPADLSGFAVITPLGLAFLAGYGVELLFTGLDRFVSAFTGEHGGRPKSA